MREIKAVHQIFKTVTILKGIHAIFEIILGFVLLLLTKKFISDLIVRFVEGRLAGDPSNFVAQYITQFGIDLSIGIKLFLAIYLVSHGIVNLSMVYGITKKPSFAYPISLVIFIGFLIYQIHDYIIMGSLWMLIIIVLDVLFLALMFYEYSHHLKTHSFLGRLKLIVKAEVPPIVTIRMPQLRIINLERVFGD